MATDRALLHFPVLSRADFLFFRLLGPGLGNLLFPMYRAFQAQRLEGGQLVFPQFFQWKPGPWLRREKDARAYGDLFRHRTPQEVLLHAAVYCGVPSAVEAFRTAAEVVDGPARQA